MIFDKFKNQTRQAPRKNTDTQLKRYDKCSTAFQNTLINADTSPSPIPLFSQGTKWAIEEIIEYILIYSHCLFLSPAQARATASLTKRVVAMRRPLMIIHFFSSSSSALSSSRARGARCVQGSLWPSRSSFALIMYIAAAYNRIASPPDSRARALEERDSNARWMRNEAN